MKPGIRKPNSETRNPISETHKLKTETRALASALEELNFAVIAKKKLAEQEVCFCKKKKAAIS